MHVQGNLRIRNNSDNITSRTLPVFDGQCPSGIVSTFKSVSQTALNKCTTYLGILSVALCANSRLSLLYSDMVKRFVTYRAFFIFSLVEFSCFAVWFFKSLRCF